MISAGNKKILVSVHILHNHVRGWDGGQDSLDDNGYALQGVSSKMIMYFYTLMFKVVRKSSSFDKPQVDTISKKNVLFMLPPIMNPHLTHAKAKI